MRKDLLKKLWQLIRELVAGKTLLDLQVELNACGVDLALAKATIDAKDAKIAILEVKQPRADWVIHTRDEVADIELEAAETHAAWMAFFEDHPEEIVNYPDVGDIPHHEKYLLGHEEAAYYTLHPEVE